WLPVLRRTSS
ncbi:unnamed protein product, partial [Allacma fusca]